MAEQPVRRDEPLTGSLRETRDEIPEAVPAATVILLRDGAEGLEALMLRRNSKLEFAGGMWVFPGGRVDPEDYLPERPDDVEAAVRVAAVREAEEEAGLACDPDAMVPFAHWTPPMVAIKRFATWFFVAEAPTGAVTIDDGEIHEHTWARPADALARRDAGEVELAPPTWVTLDRLARSATVAEALEEARVTPAEAFVTAIAKDGDDLVALWHGDAGYETGDPTVEGPRHRLVMAKGAWRYHRD
jgi:8-oxo-dGTP pyrophosphatase MutT (NUDIX family)